MSKNQGLFQKFILLIPTFVVMVSLGACETTENLVDPPVTEPLSHVYFDDYDQIWRAIQLAVRKYPVRLNNIESGLLETDYVKGDKLFSDPSEGGPPKASIRYKINIRAVKGKNTDSGHPAIVIYVTKTAEIQPDFFTGFQGIPSNGLEEQAILYRIGRYLEMDRKLSQSAK